MYLCYSNLRSLPYLMYLYLNKEDPVDCSYLVNIIIIYLYTNVFVSHIIYVDFNNCNLMNFLV